jgi:hypothetical protein
MSEYLGLCTKGHRSYLRLETVREGDRGRCPRCGRPAELWKLSPPGEPSLIPLPVPVLDDEPPYP